jgi:hypothetical protein
MELVELSKLVMKHYYLHVHQTYQRDTLLPQKLRKELAFDTVISDWACGRAVLWAETAGSTGPRRTPYPRTATSLHANALCHASPSARQSIRTPAPPCTDARPTPKDYIMSLGTSDIHATAIQSEHWGGLFVEDEAGTSTIHKAAFPHNCSRCAQAYRSAYSLVWHSTWIKTGTTRQAFFVCAPNRMCMCLPTRNTMAT